jgi:biotin operon repressor
VPGHSLAQLRSSNLRAITALLGSGGPQSRADLARGSGLSRTTVSSLVSELLGTGLVVETEDRGTPYKGGSGRPPLLVALAIRPGGVAGVDIGHGHVRVAVSDRSARILAEVETQTDADPHGNATLDIAADLVRRAADESGIPATDLLTVGLCVPAPIDRRSARVDHAPWPSTSTGPVAASPTCCTSSSPAVSAPVSCSVVGSTAAPPAWPARSATC